MEAVAELGDPARHVLHVLSLSNLGVTPTSSGTQSLTVWLPPCPLSSAHHTDLRCRGHTEPQSDQRPTLLPESLNAHLVADIVVQLWILLRGAEAPYKSEG